MQAVRADTRYQNVPVPDVSDLLSILNVNVHCTMLYLLPSIIYSWLVR